MPRLSAVTRRILGIGDGVAAIALAARLTRAAVSAQTANDDRKENFNGGMRSASGDLRPAGEKFRQSKFVSSSWALGQFERIAGRGRDEHFLIGNRRTTNMH